MYHFSISDLGLFLGKSPVTIRAWERKGLMKLPRVGANRSLTINQVQDVANLAFDLGRISSERLVMIAETLSLLYTLETEKI